MDDSTKLPTLTGSSVDAHIAVRALTTEQRQDLLRFAQSVLPEGHQLKHRIDEILNKTGPQGSTVDEALAAEIYETVVEVWREVETLKGATGRESARIVEGYRHTYLAKLDNALALRFIAEHELNDLKNAFAAAHERHPDFSAWLYINELPKPRRAGALQFLQLAGRAAWVVARVGGEIAWKYWVEILVGYLLRIDTGEEYIHKYPAGRRQRSTLEGQPDVIVQGENYEIRQAFKASEHFCSWLVHFAEREQAGNVSGPVELAPSGPLQPRRWDEVVVVFLSDERIQITVGTQTETRNYAEMGFASKKNGMPIRAWDMLRRIAIEEGILKLASDSRKWAEVEKRVQEIRRIFRSLFGLTDDPLPYIKKTRRDPEDFGYHAQFKIGLGPSYKY